MVKPSSGGQQVQLELPDLTTIDEQLLASGTPAQRSRARLVASIYVGERRRGALEIRDMTDLRGTFRVRGHRRPQNGPSPRRRNHPVSESRSRVAGSTSWGNSAERNTTRLPPTGSTSCWA